MTVSAHLAEAIEARRKALYPSVTAFAQAAGVTAQGLAPLRRGEVRDYQDRLKLPVCRALHWTPDSIDRLLAGDEPVEAVSQPDDDVWDRIERLERAVLYLAQSVKRDDESMYDRLDLVVSDLEAQLAARTREH